MSLSKGEQLVRVQFNIGNDDLVNMFKQKYAELINMVEENKDKDPRLAALAITAYEQAAMWAVKLATT